eukprot:4501303-Prymnesium_polylepis.1
MKPAEALQAEGRDEGGAERACARLAHGGPRVGERHQHELLQPVEALLDERRRVGRVAEEREQRAERLLAHHRPAHVLGARRGERSLALATEERGELRQTFALLDVHAVDQPGRCSLERSGRDLLRAIHRPAKVELQQLQHGARHPNRRRGEERLQLRAKHLSVHQARLLLRCVWTVCAATVFLKRCRSQ